MIARTYHRDGTLPEGDGWTFVFGSNLQGVHGAGAAKVAQSLFGARRGVGDGLTGCAYAIPTKAHWRADGLMLVEILGYVARFIAHARDNPQQRFFVTRIGCGLAGHRDQDIAPMFRLAPVNCSLPDVWRPFIEPAAEPCRPVLEHPWRAEDCALPSSARA
ncbi:MAG TPA: hypothetical protein VEA40_07890 [Ramlibacter sp.]|nr:hypothetical protein [Ramlibacter sp.]